MHASGAEDNTRRSRFTARHVRQLSRSSATTPLRVIALVDFDCFYAQCESVRLGLPTHQPLGVQQFLHVIATNYAARAAGVPKVVTAAKARELCPDIVLQHVPTWREGDVSWRYRDDALRNMEGDKSSLDYYRLQSRRAFDVVRRTLPVAARDCVEKAGIDEFFVDLTAHVYGVLVSRFPELRIVEGEVLDALLPMPEVGMLDWHGDVFVEDETTEEFLEALDWDDVALSIGAEVVRDLRGEIYNQLGYTCSGGIARNKVLAKLAAGRNKPNGQTVVRNTSIESFLSTYKFTKLRGLGGKLGQNTANVFATEQLADLLPVSLPAMQSQLGSEAGSWVFRIIRGEDYSLVTPRTAIQSMLSQKTFTAPGIGGPEQADRWLQIFAADIMGRMEDQEGRRPTTLTVNHFLNGRFGPTRSKQVVIPWGARLDAGYLVSSSRILLQSITSADPSWPCLALSICVSNFKDTETTSGLITSFFKPRIDIHALDDTETTSGLITSFFKPRMDIHTSDEIQAVPDMLLIDEEEAFYPEVRTLQDLRDHIDISYDDETMDDNPSDFTAEVGHLPCNPNYQEPGLLWSQLAEEQQGVYDCPECSRSVPAAYVLEHLDWHVAKELQG